MADKSKISFFKSIKGKLILFFVLVGAIPALIVGIISYSTSSSSMRTAEFNKLEAIRSIKKTQIENYFGERLGDARVLADNPTTVEAFKAIDAAYDEANGIGFSGSGNFNFNAPAGYVTAHDEYNATFKYYMEQYGYYDLFFLNTNGDIVYSVFKEPDFGINVAEAGGSFPSAFQGATSSNQATLSDTLPYPPSNGAPAQFVTAAIRDGGRTIGVVALQIPLDAINAIMQERNGMGVTGESYLVGADKLMRSDSFLDPTGHNVET